MTPTPIMHVHPTAREASRAAAQAVGDSLRRATQDRRTARVVFAAAPSQEAMLAELTKQSVDWSAVQAYHMDEYMGMDPSRPEAFGQWLANRLPSGLSTFERIRTEAALSAEISRYSQLLASPIDLVCMGIGVNGHIAFNEPGSSFTVSQRVREIGLDLTSRQQQVDDGCFATLEAVPQRALTVTIPTLMSAQSLVCTVLGSRKAAAVLQAFAGAIDEACPASILQTRPDAQIFMDEAAADLLRHNPPGDLARR